MQTVLPLRCVIVDDDPMARTLLEDFVARSADAELIGVFESAIAACNSPVLATADVLLVDVEMPDMSGIELARTAAADSELILVTSNPHYAPQGFDVGVTDFIVKPVSYGRFRQALQRARTRGQERAAFKRSGSEVNRPNDVFVRVDGSYHRLDLDDVLWLEADGDYVRIRTSALSYFVLGTLKSWQAKLPSPTFLRVHRSFIVRFDRIASVGGNHVTIGGREIPVGATHRDALMAELKEI